MAGKSRGQVSDIRIEWRKCNHPSLPEALHGSTYIGASAAVRCHSRPKLCPRSSWGRPMGGLAPPHYR